MGKEQVAAVALLLDYRHFVAVPVPVSVPASAAFVAAAFAGVAAVQQICLVKSAAFERNLFLSTFLLLQWESRQLEQELAAAALGFAADVVADADADAFELD